MPWIWDSVYDFACRYSIIRRRAAADRASTMNETHSNIMDRRQDEAAFNYPELYPSAQRATDENRCRSPHLQPLKFPTAASIPRRILVAHTLG